jgi:hypothetical protein
VAEVPHAVEELARRRADARAAKDYATADALRDELEAAGWEVVDGPEGSTLRPLAAEPPPRIEATEVASALDEPATFDASLQWVCEGWPEDIERAIGGFRSHAGSRRLQFVVADVTGLEAGRFGDDVELVRLVDGTGWASARNAGVRR